MDTPNYKYIDLEGITWDLKINLGLANVIEASDYSAVTKIQFAFLQPGQDFFAEVFSNVQFAMALAWSIVQGQLEANYGSSPENVAEDELSKMELRFVSALDGPTLQQAKRALMSSIADFFPEQRTVLLTLQNKIEKAQKLAELEFESMDKEMDMMIERELRERAKEAREQLRGETSTEPSEPSVSNLEMLKTSLSENS